MPPVAVKSEILPIKRALVMTMIMILTPVVSAHFTNVSSSVVNATAVPTTVTKLEIIGKDFFPYDKFAAYSWVAGNCSTLEEIRFQYVQLNPNKLVKSLNGCDQLKRFFLYFVEYSEKPLPTLRVVLQNLQYFQLYMYRIQAKSASEFMAHFFFRKNSTDEIKIPSSVRLDTYWPSLRDPPYFVDYYPEKQGLDLRSMPYQYQVITYFDYTEIEAYNSFVDPKTLNVETLTTLKIENSSYHQADISELLKSAKNLLHLSLGLSSSSDTSDLNPQPLSLDLSLLPSIKRLRSFTVRNIEVWSSELVKLIELRTLSSRGNVLNLTTIHVPNSLEDLILQNATLVGEDMEILVCRMNNLTLLRLDYRRTSEPDQEFDLNSLTSSAHSLSSLTLNGMYLHISSSNLEFPTLKSLDVVNCTFRSSMNNLTFDKIFSNLTEITIGNTVSYEFFKAVLNSTCLEKIVEIRTGVEVPQIEELLLESGVPAGLNFESIVLGRSNSTRTGWSWSTSLDLKTFKRESQLRDLALYFYVLVLATVCVFGILGNILSAIVLTRRNMQSSSSFILLGLTLCDSLVLFTYVFSTLYFGIKLILVFYNFRLPLGDYQIFGFRITELFVRKLDEFQYTCLYPLNKTAYTGSVYATMLLTFERFVAVCWPFHARRLLRPRSVTSAILFVLSFAVILNTTRWFEARQYVSGVSIYDSTEKASDVRKVLYFKRNTHLSGFLRNRYYRQYFHGFIWIAVMYFIPISTISYLNFRILRQLSQSKQNRGALSASTQRNQQREGQEEQMASLTRMLIWVITIFIVCNSASGIIVWYTIYYLDSDPNDSEIFSCIPLIINSSINFVIYALLGTKFRSELSRLLTSCRNVLCRNRNNMSSDNNFPLSSITNRSTLQWIS